MMSSTASKNNGKNAEAVKLTLYVKYMVCLRDKISMQTALDKQGINYRISVQGAIEFLEDITKAQLRELKTDLSKSGLVLLAEKESMLVDRIIHTIIEIVHYTDALPKVSFRDLFSTYLISEEESILKIFSDVKGMSVLQFIVLQKIERAKELMLYENMPLEKIADKLNYKNKDYLIAQFKKTTGLTPTYFEQLKNERMKISQENRSSSRTGATNTETR